MFHLVDLFTLIIRERDWKERGEGEILEGEEERLEGAGRGGDIRRRGETRRY